MTSERRARSNPLLSLVRTIPLVAAMTALAVVLSVALLWNRRPGARIRCQQRFLHLWGRVLSAIAGWRYTVVGTPPPPGAMLAPNHLGYADIVVMAAAVPCHFMTRTEYMAWPGIGHVMRLAGMIPAERHQSRAMSGERSAVCQHLEHGGRLCVFLEGTSTGGDRVLPFRTNFVQSAIDSGAPIVPVAIRWHARPGGHLRIDEDLAFWKDHEFGPHLWRVFGLNGFSVEIEFLEPIETRGANRKDIARLAREAVAAAARLPMREELVWTPPETKSSKAD